MRVSFSRSGSAVLAVVMSLALLTPPTHAVTLPAKDSTAAFGSNYGLGYGAGSLYLHTGNSIYKLNAGGTAFDPWMTGLETAFSPTRSFEGTFATSANGKALIAMGYSDGGVLLIDLPTQSITNLSVLSGSPDFDGVAGNEDNIYSAASRADGTFFATWASRAFFPVDATKVYAINPATPFTTSLVKDVAPGDYSGGMAFDSAGNLIIGTFVPNFSNPGQGTANFYRITAAGLALFELNGTTPAATFLGSGAANGNGFIVVDTAGNIYFDTTTGIGVLPNGSSSAVNFYGNITDPDIFATPATVTEGLAYDALNNRLAFAQKGEGNYSLVLLEIPEPASLGLLTLAGAALISRKSRAGR